MLSPSDTAIVFLLALLLFGPEQLPKLARQLGEAMRHIQNTTHTFMQEMERAADSSEAHEHGSDEPAPFEAPNPGEEASETEASPPKNEPV
jgi:sec-independent protein translocase protein TatB